MNKSKLSAALHPMPFTRIELAILSVIDGQLQVMLIRRAEAPAQGLWALPGGVLRIDLDADLEAAARRVAKERLGIALGELALVTAAGGAARDPRAPWTLSLLFQAFVQSDAIQPQPGKRVEAFEWRPFERLATDDCLAFDHQHLTNLAVAHAQTNVRNLAIPAGLMPATFTLTELQASCESVLGAPLDKSRFRQRVEARQLVFAVPGATKTGAFRPAQIYRLSAAKM